MRTWQLQEAKNRFSHVIDEALMEGPQVVTRHGVDVAVVLSYEQFRKMIAQHQRLSDQFRQSPHGDVKLDLRRDACPIRDEFSP